MAKIKKTYTVVFTKAEVDTLLEELEEIGFGVSGGLIEDADGKFENLSEFAEELLGEL